MKNKVQLYNIEKRYGNVQALISINLDILSGEFVSLIGPNGSGKTTLLKIINGLVSPSAGEVNVFGVKAGKRNLNHIRSRISYLNQDFFTSKLPVSVLDIVLMGRYGKIGLFGRISKKDTEIAMQSLEAVQMEDYYNKNINELSGGQKQRVFLAKAFCQEGEILLLDEPTSFLDIEYQQKIMEIIKKKHSEKSLTTVMVTHDLAIAKNYSERVIFLNNGIIHSQGRPDDILQTKNIQSVYELQTAGKLYTERV